MQSLWLYFSNLSLIVLLSAEAWKYDDDAIHLLLRGTRRTCLHLQHIRCCFRHHTACLQTPCNLQILQSGQTCQRPQDYSNIPHSFVDRNGRVL